MAKSYENGSIRSRQRILSRKRTSHAQLPPLRTKHPSTSRNGAQCRLGNILNRSNCNRSVVLRKVDRSQRIFPNICSCSLCGGGGHPVVGGFDWRSADRSFSREDRFLSVLSRSGHFRPTVRRSFFTAAYNLPHRTPYHVGANR